MESQETIQICGRDWPGEKILDRANEALSILHNQIVKYDDDVDKIDFVTDKLLKSKTGRSLPCDKGRRMTRILSKYASKSLRDCPFLRSHELRGTTLEQKRSNTLIRRKSTCMSELGSGTYISDSLWMRMFKKLPILEGQEKETW